MTAQPCSRAVAPLGRADRRHDQAVGRLPERRAGDIEHRDRAPTVGAQADLHAALVGRAGGGERLGRARHAGGERRVGQADLVALAQQHGGEAAFGDERHAQAAIGLGGVGDAAARAAGLGFLPAQRVEQRGAAFEIVRAQRQAAEGFLGEIMRGQAHAFDRADRIEHDEAAQQVVHILGRGAEGDALLGGHLARALDLREAGGGEGDAADRAVPWRARWRPRGRRRV
jgi:hypothetical protein